VIAAFCASLSISTDAIWTPVVAELMSTLAVADATPAAIFLAGAGVDADVEALRGIDLDLDAVLAGARLDRKTRHAGIFPPVRKARKARNAHDPRDRPDLSLQGLIAVRRGEAEPPAGLADDSLRRGGRRCKDDRRSEETRFDR
jgi:hypothetical protein